MNAFKYGVIVDGDYFTDRESELLSIKAKMDSENHLILISPRRYGKSSLVRKCLEELKRPFIWIDLQYVLSVDDFSTQLLKGILSKYTYERIRHEIAHFRIIPMLSNNPVTNEWQIGFQPSSDNRVMLEDVMALLEKVSTPDKRPIVVLDEFQEVCNIDSRFAQQLRAIMQHQKGLNYIFMGSQESMMVEIFEKKKSPFYHFGALMHLNKIPYDIFFQFIKERLPEISNKEEVAAQILSFTSNHPYYSQQLASQVWELIVYQHEHEQLVEKSIKIIIQERDLDYERLWNTLNRTDRDVILQSAGGLNPLHNKGMASSTAFSSIKRLQKNGLIVRAKTYEIEDPFFREWLSKILPLRKVS